MAGIDITPSITAGFTFGEALLALITKTLPSDADKSAAFKAKYPRMFMRVRISILKQMFRYMKLHRNISVSEFVDFVGGTYTDAEKKDIVDILSTELAEK